MTKGEMISEVMLAVTGGKPTVDSAVLRPDIEVMLAPAINYSIVKDYYINKREGQSEIQDDFLASYLVSISNDTLRGQYLQLPQRVISLGNNKGIWSIRSPKGSNDVILSRASRRGHNQYYTNLTGDYILAYPEGQRVYLDNVPPSVTSLLVTMVASVADLDEDDQVPVPAGVELEVIKILVDHFLGQREIPKDTIVNSRDDLN